MDSQDNKNEKWNDLNLSSLTSSADAKLSDAHKAFVNNIEVEIKSIRASLLLLVDELSNLQVYEKIKRYLMECELLLQKYKEVKKTSRIFNNDINKVKIWSLNFITGFPENSYRSNINVSSMLTELKNALQKVLSLVEATIGSEKGPLPVHQKFAMYLSHLHFFIENAQRELGCRLQLDLPYDVSPKAHRESFVPGASSQTAIMGALSQPIN